MDEVERFNELIEAFKIKARCINYNKVNNYYSYDIILAPGERVAKLKKFLLEISLQLMADCKPTLKTLFKEGVIKLEFISKNNSILNLSTLLNNKAPSNMDLPCIIGKLYDDSNMWLDLSKNPNMIVAGTTGSGKSILLNNIVYNLYNYTDSIIFLVDPKNIEFSKFEGVNNTYVGYTYDCAVDILEKLNEIMNNRFRYSKEALEKSKPIILIIDELASLVREDTRGTFNSLLLTLSQKCRAAKIYTIVATQRPSADIITGAIKANFPARIACRVASHIDSKVILDDVGAEDLLGAGDAILKLNGEFSRFKVAYC